MAIAIPLSSTTNWDILLSLLLILGIYKVSQSLLSKGKARSLPYPPGPKPKFLLGNALDFPKQGAPGVYVEWGRKFKSDILHLEALGNHVIVLNNLEDADELLDRRANNYSDRPDVPLLRLLGWEFNVAFFRSDASWKFHRKLMQSAFRYESIGKYFLPASTAKVHEMLAELLEVPGEWERHNKKLSIAVTMSTMYAYDVESLSDPCIRAAEESVTEGIKLLLPGNNLLTVIPALAEMVIAMPVLTRVAEMVPHWVPGTETLRKAREVRRLTEEMRSIAMGVVRKQREEGIIKPCFVSDMFEKKFREGVSKEEEEAVENIAYTVYGAASDTTLSVTTYFIYLMVTHPDIQAKAQVEIDSVTKSGSLKRLPTFSDRPNMPYMEAMYREVMRMGAPGPLNMPHAVLEEDEYKGWRIPKGATVLTNIWAMNHDPAVYPDPFKFSPERFLDEKAGKLLSDNYRVLAYGFGRRVCVGKYQASAMVWLMMVSVLACFNIRKAKDEHGNEIEPKAGFDEVGLAWHKSPFECAFELRSEEMRQLILSANEK